MSLCATPIPFLLNKISLNQSMILKLQTPKIVVIAIYEADLRHPQNSQQHLAKRKNKHLSKSFKL